MLSFNDSRSTAYYYFAWRALSSQAPTNEGRDTRGITRRVYLRKRFNPMNITEAEFIKRYGLSRGAFTFLCRELKAKTNLKCSKRISLQHKVLCALSFYASGSYQGLVGMGNNLAQTSVSKYVEEVTEALNNPDITSTFISFPKLRTERDAIKQKFFTRYGIPGICGCIDGSHFRILKPKKDIEHLYYCRKHYHSLNVQIVCDSDCRILYVNSKYGGATHDAFIWENSFVNQFMQGLHQNNEQVWLLGDSGYPQRPWLMTPIPDAAEGSPEANYSMIHGKARVEVENTFGRLRNRWRCLNKDRILYYNPDKCAKIIIACCVLHNITIEYGVPEPEENVSPNSVESHTINEIEINSLNSAGVEDYTLTSQDDLIRGRIMRNCLVERVNRHVDNNDNPVSLLGSGLLSE